VVVAELCLTEDFVASGDADGWVAGIQSTVPLANGGREAVATRRILRRYGRGAEVGGFAGVGVGSAWIARDVLGQAGATQATDESVMQVLSTYASSHVPGFDGVSCPGPGAFVAACNPSTLITRVDGDELRGVGDFVHTDFTIFEDLLGP
jgi:hypothetical protein